MPIGHCTWVFPDGELPPRQPYNASLSHPEVHGHESLVVLNIGTEPVHPRLEVYFADQPPWEINLPPIEGRRVRCYRTDEPLGPQDRKIPEGKQYGLVLICEHPVVAQLGRMDIRQPNLAYYTVLGFPSSP